VNVAMIFDLRARVSVKRRANETGSGASIANTSNLSHQYWRTVGRSRRMFIRKLQSSVWYIQRCKNTDTSNRKLVFLGASQLCVGILRTALFSIIVPWLKGTGSGICSLRSLSTVKVAIESVGSEYKRVVTLGYESLLSCHQY